MIMRQPFTITAVHPSPKQPRTETVAKISHLHLAREAFESALSYWSDSGSIIILTDDDGDVLDASVS